MKNKILASIAALLALGVSAYAQDYSYGSESTVYVPAPTSTNVSSPYTTTYTPASNTVSSVGNSNSFNGKAFRFGGRFFLGYSDFWNVDDTYDNMYDPDHKRMANPYDEMFGFNFGLGFVSNMRINSFFSIMPEIVFAYTDYSVILDSYYYRGYGIVDLEQSFSMFNLDIDPVFRLMPVDFFYLEAGARLSINLYADETLSIKDYNGKTVDSGSRSWKTCNSFFPGLILGFGFSWDGLRHRNDLGLRFVLDFTSLEDAYVYYFDKQENSHTFKSTVRRFEIQLVLNRWYF